MSIALEAAAYTPQPLSVDPVAVAFAITISRGNRAAREARLHLERHLESPDANEAALTDEYLLRLDGHAERAVRLAGSPLSRKNY